MANLWNQYQCMVTFNMSRSASLYESGIGRGMGYRDSNQDVLGFVHMLPLRARQRILDIAATQLSDGTCYHQYQPLTKKGNADIGGGFNDDPLWLILSVTAYIKETGDETILNERTAYADVPDSQATLLDHLHRSLQYTLEHRGPHGLPLIGHADWNDCLNLNCFSTTPGESFQLAGHIENDKVAESVMIAGLFCKACDEMASLLQHLRLPDQAAGYLKHSSEMRETIYRHGWDGEWFLRAYDSYGKKLGSTENEEGRIFIESQGWCILGGVGLENGYAKKALDSVQKHLATPNGIILQQPAFQKYYVHLGEVSSYPPGYKENAGIFTHNNTWIQIAETLIGRGDRAMEYYMSICPPTKEEQIDVYRSEPLRVQPDDRRKGRSDTGRRKEFVADRDGCMVVRRSVAIYSRHPSGFQRTHRRSLHSDWVEIVQRGAKIQGEHLQDHGQQSKEHQQRHKEILAGRKTAHQQYIPVMNDGKNMR